MQGCRGDQQQQRPTSPAAEDVGQRHEADGEDQHPRMEVALERVRTGLGDAVPEGEGRNPGRQGPRRGEYGPAQRDGAGIEGQQGRPLRQREPDRQPNSRQANQRAADLVHEEVAALRAEHRPVARVERWIELVKNGGDVEGLVGDAVAIAAGVQRRHQGEGEPTQPQARG